MDITLNVEDYLLNVRASGIIIHDNKILLHKNINEDHYALIGGRVAIGESSEEALKREIMEELGKEAEIIENLTTVENVFEMKNKKYYEILFVHKLEFKDEEDKKTVKTIRNVEGKDYLIYEWIDIDEIDEYPLRPKVIKDMLKNKVFPAYKYNNDLKKTEQS